jgi:hypothetical protein
LTNQERTSSGALTFTGAVGKVQALLASNSFGGSMKKFTRTSRALVLLTMLALISSASLAQAQNSCQNISGHIQGQIIGLNSACGGALTEIGSFSGNPGGTFVACITNMQQRGDGALVFDLAHTYTTTSGDTFTVTDHVIAGPIAPPLYRINNRANITGGTGLYEDAFGFIRDHGTVDLQAGVVTVDYEGRLCTP